MHLPSLAQSQEFPLLSLSEAWGWSAAGEGDAGEGPTRSSWNKELFYVTRWLLRPHHVH